MEYLELEIWESTFIKIWDKRFYIKRVKLEKTPEEILKEKQKNWEQSLFLNT